ncbi:MAG: class I SAM-dependent methyltransferase [Parvibaculum sp.]|nr:class I SAM-dependent methyltransferase [Parvibaculum sp.]
MSFASYIEKLLETANSKEEARHAAQQLICLYEEACKHPNGLFLELGTDRGQGSRAMLAACEKNGASLVSIDIRDCSGAVTSDRWTFVQASSTDRDYIVTQAPALLGGIDLVYVDSLHTPEHVEKEVYAWFDLLKPGGVMFFDDIDSGPYLPAARKDNAMMEIANARIRRKIEDIFYANVDVMDLSMIYGSTGLGVIRKRNGAGEGLRPLPPSRRRQNIFMAKISRRLFPNQYRNTGDGSDFLIPLS